MTFIQFAHSPTSYLLFASLTKPTSWPGELTVRHELERQFLASLTTLKQCVAYHIDQSDIMQAVLTQCIILAFSPTATVQCCWSWHTVLYLIEAHCANQRAISVLNHSKCCAKVVYFTTSEAGNPWHENEARTFLGRLRLNGILAKLS